MDYAFRVVDDDADEAMLPCLVMVDHEESGMWIHPADNKGDCSWDVVCATGLFDEAGYGVCRAVAESVQQASLIAFTR